MEVAKGHGVDSVCSHVGRKGGQSSPRFPRFPFLLSSWTVVSVVGHGPLHGGGVVVMSSPSRVWRSVEGCFVRVRLERVVAGLLHGRWVRWERTDGACTSHSLDRDVLRLPVAWFFPSLLAVPRRRGSIVHGSPPRLHPTADDSEGTIPP